jgi:AraC-like DNA-binding protein
MVQCFIYLSKTRWFFIEFVKTSLCEEFTIKSIVSLHYFEFAKDYVFQGEKHDFWEFLYVDKGEVEVLAGTNGYKLKQGDIIFHKPNEFHSVWANKKSAPNLIVICFDCKSKSMVFLENKILSLGDNERNLLGIILKEGFNAFCPPFDEPTYNALIKKDNPFFGCEQLIKIHLELLLINIIREYHHTEGQKRLSTSAKERSEEDIIKRITNYLQENITENITLSQVCNFSKMGRSQLVNMFKEKTGLGVIEYFKNLKIQESKKMIREEAYNITEISEILGYSSIHAFSRHFKKATGMYPTQYAKSVKARIHNNYFIS